MRARGILIIGIVITLFPSLVTAQSSQIITLGRRAAEFPTFMRTLATLIANGEIRIRSDDFLRPVHPPIIEAHEELGLVFLDRHGGHIPTEDVEAILSVMEPHTIDRVLLKSQNSQLGQERDAFYKSMAKGEDGETIKVVWNFPDDQAVAEWFESPRSLEEKAGRMYAIVVRVNQEILRAARVNHEGQWQKMDPQSRLVIEYRDNLKLLRLLNVLKDQAELGLEADHLPSGLKLMFESVLRYVEQAGLFLDRNVRTIGFPPNPIDE